jgi:hypothetical protein
MLPIIRSIRLKNGRHNLGKPFTNWSCSLWFLVIYNTMEIKAFGDKGFMLEKTIKVVSLFKIIFPTKKKLWTRKLSKNCNNINKTDFSLGSKVCFLTQKHDGWSASWTTLFQYQQPKQFQKCKIYFSGTLATDSTKVSESDGRNAVPNKLSMITLWETNKYSNDYSFGIFITK